MATAHEDVTGAHADQAAAAADVEALKRQAAGGHRPCSTYTKIVIWHPAARLESRGIVHKSSVVCSSRQGARAMQHPAQ